MSKWQDISTAPKDGTEIIGIHVTYYDFGISPTIDGPFTIKFNGKKWISSWDGCEVITYMSDFGVEYADIMEPTHWMPLPGAPDDL